MRLSIFISMGVDERIVSEGKERREEKREEI